MFTDAYLKAWEVIKQKPLKLWGLSLLSALISTIAWWVFGPVVALSFAAVYLISCGMVQVYLDGLNGKDVNADQLFVACNKKCMRVIGGMAWKDLWTLIWAFVPVYGIYKIYTYKFVPYILMTKPEVSATEALRLSKEMTKGKVLNMFLCDLCFVGAFVFISVLLYVIAFVVALIPIIGVLVSLFIFLVLMVLALAYGIFSPMFIGLYTASFYADEMAPADFEVVAE